LKLCSRPTFSPGPYACLSSTVQRRRCCLLSPPPERWQQTIWGALDGAITTSALAVPGQRLNVVDPR
jgi:hypothetical protein